MPSSEPLPAASLWFRLTLCALVCWGSAVPFVIACVVLLPWRARRIRLGGAYARWLGPAWMRLLGFRLQIDGGERVAVAEPPAIYVINHSSLIDTICSMAMWPPRGICLGKHSLIWTPGFGQAFVLAGHQLVDRRDRARAIASVQALTRAMEAHQFSLWMAPEGTRSRDGGLGPFKKGFAHIAIATRAPVIPVVFHNASALWPHKSFRVTPGTVRVTVGEPIPTDAWTTETLDRHIADVRDVFAAALEEGPASGG